MRQPLCHGLLILLLPTAVTATQDKPATPFDSSSFSDVLKLAATNLDSHGAYREVVNSGAGIPAPSEHLVVSDEWVLLARPRSNGHSAGPGAWNSTTAQLAGPHTGRPA